MLGYLKPMKLKIFKFLGLFLISVIILFIVLFKSIEVDGLYSFFYPRLWFVSDTQGNYFNGLVLSNKKINDDQTEFGRGGFIEISHEDVDGNLSVESYINDLKNDEVIKLKAGGLPSIPGPSQYGYKGVDNLGLKGFYRVTSLSALPDDMYTRLYWKINNKKLYQVFIKYPQDKSQSAIFDIVAKLFFLTFDAK